MSDTKDIKKVYEIILDEIDFFMEGMYKDNLSYKKIIEEVEENELFSQEIEDMIEILDGSDEVLSRLDNMKMLLKSIALQNHKLELFSEEEKKNVIVQMLLSTHKEVI